MRTRGIIQRHVEETSSESEDEDDYTTPPAQMYLPRTSSGSMGSKREAAAMSSAGGVHDPRGLKRSRKGKWTTEEEDFANRLIHYFQRGLLQLPEGTTLRAHVAEKLGCDPMRITKKFTGAARIGKKIYRASDDQSSDVSDKMFSAAQAHRRQLPKMGLLPKMGHLPNMGLLPNMGSFLIWAGTRRSRSTRWTRRSPRRRPPEIGRASCRERV